MERVKIFLLCVRRSRIVARATIVCHPSGVLARQVSQSEAPQQDVEDLRALVQEFVRRFGLLVTRQTPCGFPVSPSYAHALMLLVRRADEGLDSLQTDLAVGLGIDKSNVARLCEKMVDAGHAAQTVHPADGRSRIVKLTAKGTRLARRIEQGSHDRFSAVATHLPAEKRRAVIAALADLNAAVTATAVGEES